MSRVVSSKHLEGVSDLTLTAPIRAGFVDAMDSVTYETRLRLTMEALFKIRSTAREHSAVKPFVDTAERIQALLAFRLAILDTSPRRLLLSATFDRPFEPYMRLIWKPLGRLLDLVFCNCEGYLPAEETRFADYLAWVRGSQVDTGFFYTANGYSVLDVRYLAELERLQRDGGSPDAAAAALVVSDPVDLAAGVRAAHPVETGILGAEVLVALHRLSDVYPPDRPAGDGRFLLRAALDLLTGWNPATLPPPVAATLADKIAWLRTPLPQAAVPPADPAVDDADIQAGILTSIDRPGAPMTHGCLVLMGVGDPAAARAFLDAIRPAHSEQDFAAPDATIPRGTIVSSVALTCRGLRNLGVPEAELARFPQEFREGMEDRAGLLGDLHASHPRNWTRPARNWPAPPPPGTPTVDLGEVDVVVHLRVSDDHAGHAIVAGHPLWQRISDLAALGETHGVALLSVEPMRRATEALADPPRSHFGLADNISQPVVASAAAATGSRDEIKRGELLLGYANDREDPPHAEGELLANGTFLVVRKLRQDVRRFDALVDDRCRRHRLTRDELLGKLVGRTPDGAPLIPTAAPGSNEFDYAGDPKGDACPFQAHVRRANPRTVTNGRRNPRIMRRGMSYGPSGEADSDEERGLIFLAYNASISEQFEVIQRWVNGANSTGVFSGQGDPLIGLGATADDNRTFRFNHDGRSVRIQMNPPHEAGKPPVVALAWGTYLFVPSFTALSRIAAGFDSHGGDAAGDDAARGEALIAGIAHLPKAARGLAWKTWLEDFAAKDPTERDEAVAIWAAIRKRGGAIRVPYGDPASGARPAVEDVVLAASDELATRVFTDSATFSMDGPARRMRQSIGSIYLGMDDTPAYRAKSEKTNALLMAVSEEQAFDVAFEIARTHLSTLPAIPTPDGDAIELEVREDFITWVLAGICRFWFGIPEALPGEGEAGPFEAGGWSPVPVAQRKPRCPGDFMAPSRFCFYPDPVPAVRAYGKEQGRALRRTARAHLAALRRRPGEDAPIARAIDGFFAHDHDEAARTLIGVMVGFLPPTDGCLRGVLFDWLQDKTLWRMQRRLATAPAAGYAGAAAAIGEPIRRAIQKRPAPDMVWRRATAATTLGGVAVKPNDRVFIGIVSAFADRRAADPADLSLDPVFGGRRGAAPDGSFPIHACPAYRFAMGTMTGMVAALLGAGRIDALPSPLMLKLIRRPAPAAGRKTGRDEAGSGDPVQPDRVPLPG